MIDLMLIGVIAIVTWMVAGEGPWGAALTLFAVVISGLVAMNLFEPVAALLESLSNASVEWRHMVDIIALLGIFSLCVFGLRSATDYLMPVYVEVHTLVYDIGRWAFALITGYVVAAILLTALHTAPLGREPFGFKIERPGGNLFDFDAPDLRWLAFVQYASESSLSGGAVFDGNKEEIPRRLPPTPQRTWSSFPFKYAKRREDYVSAAKLVAGPPPPPGGAPGPAPMPNAPPPKGGGANLF